MRHRCAAPEVFGVAGWQNRHFWKRPDDATATPFLEEDGRLPGSADKELMGLLVGSVAGCADRPEKVLFIGVDNLNAVCWVAIAKARRKFARMLLGAFLF